MKVTLYFIYLLTSITSFSQQKVQTSSTESIAWSNTTINNLDEETAIRYCTFEGNKYKVQYVYNPNWAMVPLTYPPGPNHYDAIISVYREQYNRNNLGYYIQIGEQMNGQYVREGCFEDIPENFIRKALKDEDKKLHRKHIEGMVFTIYPPIYSCAICYKEFNPQEFLPKEYLEMKIPIILTEKDTLYFNGYGKFCDSLKRKHINEDSFFFAKWNEIDTTCISYEIAVKKSEDIWNKWIKTHKKGKYYLNKEEWMDTSGYIGGNNYIIGGRFNDKTLLIDKWYKVIYDKIK